MGLFMDMELSKGYFPKYDQTKTFDIVSNKTENKVGEITFAAFRKEVALNSNANKMWRFVGILDEVISECWLSYDPQYDFSRNRRIKEELFGIEPKKTVISKNLSFEGMLYQNDDDYMKYSFEIKEVKVNGRILKNKTGKKRWEEDYSVPYLSGKSVDEMVALTSSGNRRTQKEVGKLILDKFEGLVAGYNTNVWRVKNNELAEEERNRKEIYEKNEKPKTKRNIPLVAGISAGLASLWYFFTK